MMNLEKMKQKKRTITKSRVKKSLLAATTFLCLTTPLLQTQTAYAAENTTPAITIEKPDGWKQGETIIAVTVDASHMPEGFSIAKIEAKAGKDGSWQDVTGSGSITITGNQTVYVRVTDGEGKVYEQNRSIKCYDTEKPTLSASLTDGVLTIQGNDTVSGITAVTVNGTTYTDLKDGMLRVQLTQKDFTTKQIEITVTDGAGNTSEKYVLQNPYYEWAKKQAEKQKTSSDSKVKMNSDYALSLDDIHDYEKIYGKIPKGAFVAMRSDWGKRWPSQEKFQNMDEYGEQHYPGWSLEAVKYLIEKRDVTAIGHETFDTDPPFCKEQRYFQAECYVLKQDRYQIEMLTNLDKIPERGAIIFCIFVKQTNGTGFPVRCFAICPNK